MQFTHSQGLCISKKCFLPRVAVSLLLPEVLIHFHIPLSLSCFLHPFLVSLWYLRPFPVLLWWLNIPQLHSSAAGLCRISPILPFPLASVLCTCVPRVGVLFHLFLPEVYHIPFPPLFFPLSLYGGSPRLVTPLLPSSPGACAKHSKWEEVSAGPTQAGAPVVFCRPLSLGKKVLLLQLSSSKETCGSSSTGWECQASLCSAVPLPDCSLLSSIPSGESGKLWRKEIICPSWAWQMTPWLRKFSNINDYTVLGPILIFQICN